MTTATVPVTIVCPDWCIVSAEEHAADLWNAGGECHHTTETVEVLDPVGHIMPMEEPRIASPISLALGSATQPDNGREVRSPIIWLEEREHTIEQMEALAQAITSMVESYRATAVNK